MSRPRAKRWGGVGLGLLLLVALSCQKRSAAEVANGGDPIAALAAPQTSALYDAAFWAREFHRQTPIWKRAVAFCRERREAPNCHAVHLAALWEAPPYDEAVRFRPARRPRQVPPPPLRPEDR